MDLHYDYGPSFQKSVNINNYTIISTLNIMCAIARAHHKSSRRAINCTQETALTYIKNLPNDVKLTK